MTTREQGQTPETDAIIADCKVDWKLADRHELLPADRMEAMCISTPTGAAVVVKHARKLERERDELVRALEAIVAIDDGDKPDLWRFEAEFELARKVLLSAKRGK